VFCIIIFAIVFSYSGPSLGVPSANITKNIEGAMIREHKLRKRFAFSLDMGTIRKDFC
jgi:hypothetical protein